MHLPRSAQVAELVIFDQVASTNDELLERADAADEFTVVVTGDQTAGRGRLGRAWLAPAGRTIAASVLLRPAFASGRPMPPDRFGWFPMIAGLAMTQSIRQILPGREVLLKWPNDVLVGGRKVCGLLAEFAPGSSAVVIGSGVNLSLSENELPVPSATSLALEGADAVGDELADALLSGYLAGLRRLVSEYAEAGADAGASGIRAAVEAVLGTLGRQVRVELPGGATIAGTATGIDDDARLVVTPYPDGAPIAVTAGDVTHLRHA